MRSIQKLLIPVLLIAAQPCLAIREGTANANIFITIYEARGDFGKLALWHEAAAECLTRISVPMNQIALRYYKHHGYKKLAARAKKEALEIQRQHHYHRIHAQIAWKKSKTPESVLNTEREHIAKFIATWLPRYPTQFYTWGIYPTFFRKQRHRAEQKDDYVKALHLEADAAEMCAAQYQKIPIAYGLRNYEKHREAYLQHATRLRNLAQQNPKTLPPEAYNGNQRIQKSLETQTVASQQKTETIRHTANADLRVKTALAAHKGVHQYAQFQGSTWFVNFYNHSRGHLLSVIIDDKTGNVLDVLKNRLSESN